MNSISTIIHTFLVFFSSTSTGASASRAGGLGTSTSGYSIPGFQSIGLRETNAQMDDLKRKLKMVIWRAEIENVRLTRVHLLSLFLALTVLKPMAPHLWNSFKLVVDATLVERIMNFVLENYDIFKIV